jgi:hypothetical protein
MNGIQRRPISLRVWSKVETRRSTPGYRRQSRSVSDSRPAPPPRARRIPRRAGTATPSVRRPHASVRETQGPHRERARPERYRAAEDRPPATAPGASGSPRSAIGSPEASLQARCEDEREGQCQGRTDEAGHSPRPSGSNHRVPFPRARSWAALIRATTAANAVSAAVITELARLEWISDERFG